MHVTRCGHENSEILYQLPWRVCLWCELVVFSWNHGCGRGFSATWFDLVAFPEAPNRSGRVQLCGAHRNNVPTKTPNSHSLRDKREIPLRITVPPFPFIYSGWHHCTLVMANRPFAAKSFMLSISMTQTPPTLYLIDVTNIDMEDKWFNLARERKAAAKDVFISRSHKLPKCDFSFIGSSHLSSTLGIWWDGMSNTPPRAL
jgi:hypothetical protein